MVFSKYLFTTILGLTGGVNAWAFTSSGGATIGRELEGFNGELESNSEDQDKLINQENQRLSSEKKESDQKFSQLESENKKTQEKSRTRRSSGDQLKNSDHELKLKQFQQNKDLETKRNELQSGLESKSSEFKNKLESGARNAFTTVQKSVKEETEKLSQALSKLKESNKRLIEKVKNCINELPQSIFVEPKELNGKNYCDYVAEKNKSKLQKS